MDCAAVFRGGRGWTAQVISRTATLMSDALTCALTLRRAQVLASTRRGVSARRQPRDVIAILLISRAARALINRAFSIEKLRTDGGAKLRGSPGHGQRVARPARTQLTSASVSPFHDQLRFDFTSLIEHSSTRPAHSDHVTLIGMHGDLDIGFH